MFELVATLAPSAPEPNQITSQIHKIPQRHNYSYTSKTEETTMAPTAVDVSSPSAAQEMTVIPTTVNAPATVSPIVTGNAMRIRFSYRYCESRTGAIHSPCQFFLCYCG